jgi:hypothetical protein
MPLAAESKRSAKEARSGLAAAAGADDDAETDADAEEEDEADDKDEDEDEVEEAAALPLLLHRLQLSTDITGSVARDPEAAKPLHRARCCG